MISKLLFLNGLIFRLLASSLSHFAKLDLDRVKPEEYMEWLDGYPAQVTALTAEIWWSNQMEAKLSAGQVDRWLILLRFIEGT